MKNAPKNRAQPAVVAGALVMMLGVSGCNLVAEQSTTNPYAPSDGIVKDVGPLEMRNVLIVGRDDETSGRLIGTVLNTSDEPVDLTIRAAGAGTDITIEGQDHFRFEDEASDDATLEGVDDIPGSLVDVTFEVEGETAVFQVPVLDGTLEEYREYVPGGYTEPPAEPEPAGEGEEEGE